MVAYVHNVATATAAATTATTATAAGAAPAAAAAARTAAARAKREPAHRVLASYTGQPILPVYPATAVCRGGRYGAGIGTRLTVVAGVVETARTRDVRTAVDRDARPAGSAALTSATRRSGHATEAATLIGAADPTACASATGGTAAAGPAYAALDAVRTLPTMCPRSCTKRVRAGVIAARAATAMAGRRKRRIALAIICNPSRGWEITLKVRSLAVRTDRRAAAPRTGPTAGTTRAAGAGAPRTVRYHSAGASIDKGDAGQYLNVTFGLDVQQVWPLGLNRRYGPERTNHQVAREIERGDATHTRRADRDAGGCQCRVMWAGAVMEVDR